LSSGSIPRALAQVSGDFALQVFEATRNQALARRALDQTGRWQKRSCPLKAPLVFWLTVMLMLFREDSIVVVLDRLLGMLRLRDPAISIQDVTPEAVCLARYRLGVEPLEVAFGESARRIEPPPSFHGLRVHGVDGTKMEAADTPANEEAFGRPAASRGHSAYPQLAVVMLVDVVSHRVRAFSFGPCNTPERPGGLAVLDGLGPEDVVLFDRGYPSRLFFWELRQRQVHFVARLASTWGLKVVEVLEDGSSLVDLEVRVPLPEEMQTPKRKTRREVLRLRLVEYQVDGGEHIRLLTDLLDPVEYPAQELAELYHQRWETELVNDSIKVHLATVKHGTQKTTFRSRRPEGVRQEIYALFLAYNLIREVMVEAAEAAGLTPLELSFTRSLQILRAALPQFEGAAEDEHPALYARLLGDLSFARIDRPRRGRSNPRVVKRKMSNFPVKAPGARGTQPDFVVQVLPGQSGMDAAPPG
jgi:hypothetical protein